MKKKIKDIRVVRPEDKLIILVDADSKSMNDISRIAEEFMNLRGKRVLCISSTLRPYIIKKGAKVALSAVIEKMLDKEEE